MHAVHVIHITAEAATLGLSVALSRAIAAPARAVDAPARRRLDRTMLGFLGAVGLSLVVPSPWRGW